MEDAISFLIEFHKTPQQTLVYQTNKPNIKFRLAFYPAFDLNCNLYTFNNALTINGNELILPNNLLNLITDKNNISILMPK